MQANTDLQDSRLKRLGRGCTELRRGRQSAARRLYRLAFADPG